MVKILANDGIDASAKQALERKGFLVETTKVEQSKLAEAIQKQAYEVLLVRSATQVDEHILNTCSGLKLVGRAGVGLDNVNLKVAAERGVEVFNTPASSSLAVAELVMASIYALARNIPTASRSMPSGGDTAFNALKKACEGTEVRGKTLGIVGFGRIGRALASYALGNGMDVMAADISIQEPVVVSVNIQGQSIEIKVPLSPLEELLAKSDYISFHVPKQANGAPLINLSMIKKMKPTACLINTARGGVIHEFDLLDALDSGFIQGAALDVFENEPKPNSALLKHPKILSTPHIGAATGEAQARIGDELAEYITKFYKVNH